MACLAALASSTSLLCSFFSIKVAVRRLFTLSIFLGNYSSRKAIYSESETFFQSSSVVIAVRYSSISLPTSDPLSPTLSYLMTSSTVEKNLSSSSFRCLCDAALFLCSKGLILCNISYSTASILRRIVSSSSFVFASLRISENF